MPAFDILGVAVFLTVQVLIGGLVYFSGKKHESRSPLLAAGALTTLGTLSIVFVSSILEIVLVELFLVFTYFAAQGLVERWVASN